MCILRQAFEVSCFVCQILLICCDSGALATLQSKGRMGNTSSMSHPPFLVSAPLLRHSDNKLISCDSGATSPPQSLPRMGNTSSMSHPGQSLNRRQISTTLTTNLFLVITALLRLWGFPLRSGDFRFALGKPHNTHYPQNTQSEFCSR